MKPEFGYIHRTNVAQSIFNLIVGGLNLKKKKKEGGTSVRTLSSPHSDIGFSGSFSKPHTEWLNAGGME